MARIAIIGAAGQLGTTIRSHTSFRDDDLIPLDRKAIDIVDANSVNRALSESRPEIVINAAAYNFVDRAEDEPQAAWAANALGPRNLARWCEEMSVALVHVSTDYVFGGEDAEAVQPDLKPRREEDCPRPLSVYGVSKLAGEYFVRETCRRHFVVRTCGLYGRSAGLKGNFVETMLRLGRERPEIRVVADQQCTPTSTAVLTDALHALVRSDAYGLYHATSSGQTTWHAFACEIFRQSGLTVEVRPITSAEFGAAAKRPPYSVLECEKLSRLLGWPMPAWQDSLAVYLGQRSSR